jgi:hypothetical protein
MGHQALRETPPLRIKDSRQTARWHIMFQQFHLGYNNRQHQVKKGAVL